MNTDEATLGDLPRGKGDPDFYGYPGEDQANIEQEVSLGWAIFELQKASKFLNENCLHLTTGDLADIAKATEKLQDIPRKLNKPF